MSKIPYSDITQFHAFLTNLSSFEIYNNIYEAVTLETFILPHEINMFGGRKYIFHTKYKINGTIKDKTRLIVIEFNQTFGINYPETFAPVVKIISI